MKEDTTEHEPVVTMEEDVSESERLPWQWFTDETQAVMQDYYGPVAMMELRRVRQLLGRARAPQIQP